MQKIPLKREEYVTVEEASMLLNVAERTVRRMIERGDLRVLKERHSVRIDLDAIEAWNERKPHQPHPIKAHLEKHDAHLENHDAQIAALKSQIEQLTRSIQMQSSGGDLPVWEGPQARTLPAHHLSAAEKRGLPPGTLRLVDFAKAHGISVGMLKSLYNAQAIALTVYQRSGYAERNKQEWWITPEEHMQLAAYLREQRMTFEPCPDCLNG